MKPMADGTTHRGAPRGRSESAATARLQRMWSAIRRHVRAFVSQSKLGVVGAVIVVFYIVVALMANTIAPYSPLQVFPSEILQPPSSAHWMGTDANGMDVLSRIVHAARLDLAIAFTAVAIALAVGSVVGLVIGYRGGWLDSSVMRLLDVFQSFPVLILALAIVAATGQSLANVIVIIALLDTPVFVRVARAQAITLREHAFIDSAKAVGNPTWRILALHIQPNALPPVVVETSTRLAWAVKVTASLAFVGVGIQVPTAEWGAMIRQGSGNLVGGQWWVAVFAGLAVMILVLGINLFADGVQDYLDPRNE